MNKKEIYEAIFELENFAYSENSRKLCEYLRSNIDDLMEAYSNE